MNPKYSRVLILGLVLCLRPDYAKGDPVLEDTFAQSYQIEPRTKISIQNADGSVRIYGADIKEMKLEAIKRAYSAERLARISINVSVKPGAISIDTQYPPKPKWGLFDRSGTVDYVIVLPWTCDISQVEVGNGEVQVDGMRGEVRANLGNGRLFAHDCFADLHLSVANGGLDVGYEWWETQKFSIDAEITNGNARAFIPGEAAFHLQAESVNGQVASDFVEQEDRQKEGAPRIDIVVGDASATELRFHSLNGNIRIEERNP